MKKKLVSIILAAAMVLTFAAGCGNGNAGNSDGKDNAGTAGEEAGDSGDAAEDSEEAGGGTETKADMNL